MKLTQTIRLHLKTYSIIATLAASAVVVACSASHQSNSAIATSGGNSVGLRALTSNEREADFDALTKGMRNYYGPLTFKENRFGFKFDDLAADYRKMASAAQTDDEFIGVVKQFLSRFHDGHVSIEVDVEKNIQIGVPIVITPVENRAIVATIADETLTKENNIERGDEVLEIDGQPTMSYLPSILKYDVTAAAISDQHLIARALIRKSYMIDLKPTKPTVTLKIAKPSGETFERTLVWKTKKDEGYIEREFPFKNHKLLSYSGELADVIKLSIDKMGDDMPFFMTEKAIKAFNFVRVVPSESGLKKYGMTDMTKTPKLFAAMYRYDGKTFLLLRQPTYMVEDPKERIAWFKAVMDEYGSLADALVLDQTHNPGGSLEFAQDFVSLFAKENTRGLVNFLHADRAWLADLSESIADLKKNKQEASGMMDYSELGYKLVESAYDKGLQLTETPIPFGGLEHLKPADYTWKKPVLLLTDELAGSCGDIVPMLMKENKLATLFGERTMGLGGNVEPILTLGNSQIKVHLTRGFFVTFQPDGKYDLVNPTENNGVTPDIHYSHSVDDFRAGFVGYVKAFSNAAAALTAEPSASPSK